MCVETNKVLNRSFLKGYEYKNLYSYIIEDNILNSLINKYPYFAKADIKAGTYKGQNIDVSTFGVKAVLVTNENMDDNIVYFLVKAILENFDEFKKLHPAYANITKESLLNGLSAPWHDGAKRYFKAARGRSTQDTRGKDCNGLSRPYDLPQPRFYRGRTNSGSYFGPQKNKQTGSA